MTSNLQPVSGSHCYPVAGGGNGCWNPFNLVQNESIALGLNWRQDLGGTFKLDNKLRYTITVRTGARGRCFRWSRFRIPSSTS
jgi:hypothetical protein